MCLIRVGAKLCRDTGPPGSTFPTPALNRTFFCAHVDANIVMVILIMNWPLYYKITFSYQTCLVSAKPVVSRLGATPSNTSSFGLPYRQFKFVAALQKAHKNITVLSDQSWTLTMWCTSGTSWHKNAKAFKVKHTALSPSQIKWTGCGSSADTHPDHTS